jgi:gamma-glutamylcyclotransferase (GGCT)/AIG2-like uncharacterized protein YtfP
MVTTTLYQGNANAKRMVAVYGSLRVGEGNDPVNERAGARYLGQGKTCENYNLYEHGGKGYPHVSMAHNDSGTPVVVDVFEITQAALTSDYDGLEGYPTFYNRTEITVDMYNGDIAEAWMYHIDEDWENPVRSGDWAEHLREWRASMGISEDEG